MRMSGASARPEPEPLHLALKIGDFAAQAIEAREPARRGRAFVVVRQSAASHKSSVFARSRQAREMGIDAGMPVFIARRRLPRLEVLLRRPDFEDETRGRLLRLVETITPACRCDGRELWMLDLSGTPAQRNWEMGAFAEALRRRLFQRVGLDGVAIAVSRLELLARMQAGAARADEVRVCEPGREDSLLAGLEAGFLPGLSRSCRALLARYGLKKVGQIRLLGRRSLVKRFGAEGELLFELVRGAGSPPSSRRREELSAETILDWDIVDWNLLVQCVRYTADKLCYELRSRDVHLSSLALTLRYADGVRARRSRSLAQPTQRYAAVAAAAAALFEQLCQRRIAVKSIRISASRTRPETAQLDLFESVRDRKNYSLGRSIQAIRDRVGFAGILPAASLPVCERDPTAAGQPARGERGASTINRRSG